MTNPLRTIVILVLLEFICGASSLAQNAIKTVTVSGFVSGSNNEKLPGVNVYLKGTTTGTVTNENGYYSLKVQEGNATIVYSFIGYQAQEKSISLKGDKALNVTLEQNEEMLQEISITSQRKFFGNMDYGRDIPMVKSEEIEKLNSTNASDILHARLSGVWATKTSGAPGDQQKIRIRGQASFFSSSEPLYVIDGVPVPIVNLASFGIGDLNMHDIESVTVLKDASSTALYGYQGGNGVVLIDTKQRSENKLDFSYRTGVQWFNNYYDLMNTQDYIESLGLAKINIKVPIKNYVPDYQEDLCDHNRQYEVFKNGVIQEYQISGGGAKHNMNFYLSGNYINHKGIVEKSALERYNLSFHLGTKVNNKFAFEFSYRWSYQENMNNQNEYLGNQMIFEGIAKSPILDCTPDSLLYSDDHELQNRMLINYPLLNTLETPDYFKKFFNSYNFSSNAASLMGRYQIKPHLSCNIIESAMIRRSVFKIDSHYKTIHQFKQNITGAFINISSDENIILLNHQLNLSYDKTFGLNHFNATVANRYYADNLNWEVDTTSGDIPEYYFLKNSMAGYGNNGSVIRKINSAISNLSYNYNEKYYLSLIANFSQIKEGQYINYITLFPSVSASWNIAKELFQRNIDKVQAINLYANYGVSGNYPLNGLSNELYKYAQNDYFYENIDETKFVIEQFSNLFLKHESNTEFDIGLKLGFINGRLNVNTAFFNKKIGNQIVQRTIPQYYAGGKMYVNLGNINVNGFEFGLEYTPIKTKYFEWNLIGNINHFKQMVTKLADDKSLVFETADILNPKFVVEEGSSLGDIYGYKYLGKYTNEDLSAADNHYVNKAGFKYLNGEDGLDKLLNEKDIVKIGNSIPRINWNLLNTISWKQFALDVVVYSSWGWEKFNATRAGTFITGVNKDLVAMYTDTISVVKQSEFYNSSFFVEDASFIRIKSINLNYYPQKKIFGAKCGFTVGIENIYTYTRYKGFDPEATIFTDNNFSDNAIDRGAYPNPSTFVFTLNIKI